MRDFTDAVIREQLATVADAHDMTVRYVHRMADDVDRFGRPFTARQRLRQIWEARLRGARLHSPADGVAEAYYDSLLAALRDVAPDEPLYSWGAQTSDGHYFSGTSTPLRIISIDCTDSLHNPIT